MLKRWIIVLTLILSFGLTTLAMASPVSLVLWTWHEPQLKLIGKMIPTYIAENPNVKIEAMTIAGGEYWRKVMLAFAGENPPDLLKVMQDNFRLWIPEVTPFPNDMFPRTQMRKDVFACDTFFYEHHGSEYAGRMYAMPNGLMGGAMFYNLDMMADAGFTEADYPKSWEDLRILGKKLTKFDSKGNMEIAGFGFNGRWTAMFVDFIYQMGSYLLNEDGTKSNFRTPEALKIVNFLYDLTFKDKVTSPLFPSYSELFQAEKTPMTYCWTWFGGFIEAMAGEKLKWGVSTIPTPSGKYLPAIGRVSNELGWAVPKNIASAKKREAFKFMKWLMYNNDYQVANAKMLGVVPSMLIAWKDPQIVSDPLIQVLAKTATYGVFPGEMGEGLWLAVGHLEERAYAGVSAKENIEAVATELDESLAKTPASLCIERLYKPHLVELK